MNGAFGSLISVNDQPLVLLTLSALIICGGLGFVVWQDLWNYRKRRQLFLHTKIVLASTGILLAGGALLFLLLEWNNPKTIGSMPFWQKLLNAFFQSVTTRTAGFDALNNPGMTGASKLVSTVLMFIRRRREDHLGSGAHHDRFLRDERRRGHHHSQAPHR